MSKDLRTSAKMSRKFLLSLAAVGEASKSTRTLRLELDLAEAAQAHTAIYQELIQARAEDMTLAAERAARPTKKRRSR
jgi:hypothetical protein